MSGTMDTNIRWCSHCKKDRPRAGGGIVFESYVRMWICAECMASTYKRKGQGFLGLGVKRRAE